MGPCMCMCLGGPMTMLTDQNLPVGMSGSAPMSDINLLDASWAGWSLDQGLSPCLFNGGTCPQAGLYALLTWSLAGEC